MKTKTTPRPASARPKRPTAPSKGKDLSFKRILVPIDFSEAGKPALGYAKTLAKLTQAEICLFHVRELIYTQAALTLDASSLSTMRELLEREIGALQVGFFGGIKTGFRICDGLPFQEISAAAASWNADLIVMGTHGYTGLKHILMGSTAERVLRYAPCPVLVVRSHAENSDGAAKIRAGRK